MYQTGIIIALVVVAAMVCGIAYIVGEVQEIKKKYRK